MSSAAAATIDVNRVKVEDAVTVKGTSMPLNGAGTALQSRFQGVRGSALISKKYDGRQASALTGKTHRCDHAARLLMPMSWAVVRGITGQRAQR
jgi:hypothetical protein